MDVEDVPVENDAAESSPVESEDKNGEQSSESDMDAVFPAVSSRKNRKKARKLLYDDDDDSDDHETLKEGAKDVASLNGETQSSDEQTMPPIAVAKKKTKKKRIIKSSLKDDVDGSSSSEEEEKQVDEHPKPASPILCVKDRLKAMASNKRKQRDGNGANNDDNDSGKVIANESSFLKNSDLFDAEGSSTEDDRREGESVDDDPDDDGLLDIKKKAKASLKPKRTSARPRRENVQELHSESQRLLRESRVNLPRHEPPKMTLDEFLSRRKTTLKSLLRSDEGSGRHGKLSGNSVRNTTTLDTVHATSDGKPLTSSEALSIEGISLPIGTISAATVPSIADPVFGSEMELPDIDGTSDKIADLFRSIEELSKETCEEPDDLEMRKQDCPWEFETSEPGDNLAKSANGKKSGPVGQMTSTEGHEAKECSDNKLKERLSLLDARFIACTPKLAGTPQEIIHFNDDEDDDVALRAKDGIDHLIDRFVKHTSVNKLTNASGNRQVILNILQKEMDDNGSKQLTTKSITIQLDPVDDNNNVAPGHRLNVLKETLKSKLIEKREEARKRRIQLHEMDNEDGFSEEKEEEEEQEEEGIADQDTTSGEDTESDEENDMEADAKEAVKKPKSMFVDDEAEEEDGVSEGDDDDGDEESEVGNDDDVCASHNDTIKSPHIESIECNTDRNECPSTAYFSSLPRCDTLELFPSNPSEKVETDGQLLSSSLNSSIELIGSLIPAHQPDGGFRHNTESDLTPSQSQDSPRSTQGFGFSQFTVPDSQFSQSQRHLSVRRQLGLEVTSQSQRENMEELFDLCSGKWSAPESANDLGVARLCAPPSQSTQENEAELFGLCSGKFTDDPIGFNSTESMTQEAFNLDGQASSRVISDACSVSAAADDDGDDNEASDDEQSIASDNSLDVGRTLHKRRARVISDSESDDREDDHNGNASESEAEDDVEEPALAPQRNGAKDFFEDEAELSGSDASSDEEEDVAVEDDILEEELGDQEYLSEDELREQVEKVHNKLLMDEDQRQLRIYKELYLEDGELHTDGQARMRRFRWRNIDDSQNEMRSEASDADGGDEEHGGGGGAGAGVGGDGIDASFRTQRHEREKWMSQHMNFQDDDCLLNGDSLFGQLAKRITVLHKQDSLNLETTLSKSPGKQPNIMPRGSFLARRKDFLAKLAEQTKPMDNNNVAANITGPAHSRNFVFASISPPPKNDSKPPQLRRVATTPASSLTINKRPRLSKQVSFNGDQHSQNSIFNLF